MKRNVAIGLAAVAVSAACSDGTGPAGTQVSLTLAAGMGPASSASFAIMGDTLSDGQNQLVLSSVEVVMRELELKRVGISGCDSVLDVDSCEYFETGPLLVQLAPGTSPQVLTIDVEPGEYDRVEFDIHKVSGDPEDAAFRAAYPDLVETSIRVRGEYNGQSFSFTTDLMEKQEYRLSPAIVVIDGARTNVTLYVDLSTWFQDASGDLVDPGTANKGDVNENLVKDNIRESIDAFEDLDRDGRPE